MKNPSRQSKENVNRENDFSAGKIVVKGARTHNLKNISVEMPRNKMIAITGMSGSGKSSLAFDTIFAEGQRRYVESLSSYARQFLRQMGKPDVDEISGLSPAISIDQKSRSNNPRSTVATITEIYDYLRVLYARVGRPFCPICGEEIKKLSNEEIGRFIQDKVSEKTKEAKSKSGKDGKSKTALKNVMGVEFDDRLVRIFAPLVRGRKGEYYQLLYDMLGKGFARVRIDGNLQNLRDRIELDKHKAHNIDILVDEIALHEFTDNPRDTEIRLSEAVERAILETEGLVKISFGEEQNGDEPESKKKNGTVAGKSSKANGGEVDGGKANEVAVGAEEFLMSAKFACPNDGFSFPEIEPRLFSFNSPYGACSTCNGLGTKYFLGTEKCEDCGGARLRKEALNVFLGANGGVDKRKNVVDVTSMSVTDAVNFFGSLKLTPKEKEIAKTVLREIEDRLIFLYDVGLDYLALDRRANTLSGGEAQRIRLASQLGSKLVGAMYVLDEPTIGLHQRDNERLIKTLEGLRDLGNTIIVVEHDEDTIYASDYIIDIGPKAGVHGGEVIASGWLSDMLEKTPAAKKLTNGSRTLAYLRKEAEIAVPENRREGDKGVIKIVGANIFNIQNQNMELPLGKLVAITGVSGSGKSSFLYEVLYKNLQGKFERKYRTNTIYNCATFTGHEYLSRAILIDQSPIGRTPRSNLATYTGAFTHIRDLFAATEEARLRGWKVNRFSFNVKGGRCEACEGNGEIAVEMHFLPTVYVTCDVCNGKRFDKETLTVKFKRKNIYEILEMTVEEALEFFKDVPSIYDRLKTLDDVGLGYIKLGQSAKTLSGGEAQRVKIASELYRPHLERTMYLLDEPTVGLHYDDVQNLIAVLNRLVAKGNSVIVIEHNLDLIKCADYLLDFGPEGGEGGGKIIARGTPEEVANNPKSHTGKYLKRIL